MTGRAAADFTPQQLVNAADSDTYNAAVAAATNAVEGLADPEDRSQLAWELASQFCQPDVYRAIDAEAAEYAIIDAIRARPSYEHADILNRAVDEFTDRPRIAWSELGWAALVVVLVALVLGRASGLTGLSQGAVLGFGLAVCFGYVCSFGSSVIDHRRRKSL